MHRPVAGDARRPRVAGDPVADRRRPALDELRHPGLRPEARELRRASSTTEPFQASTSTTCAGSTGSADRVRRRDHRLPHARNRALRAPGAGRGRAPRARRRAEAAAGTGAARPRPGAATARRAAARPASRTGAGHGRRSPISTSSRCGPEPGRAALEIAGEPRLERFPRRRLRLVAEHRRRPGRAPRRVRAKPGASAASVSRRLCHELRAEQRDLLRPRLECVPAREAELHAPQRGVPLRERGEVVLRQPCACGKEPAERPVEVRAASGRPTLDDRKPVGREDERCDLAAQRLGGRKLRAVQARLLRLALAERHSELERRAVPRCPRRPRGRPSRRSGSAARPVRVRGEKPCVPTCSDSSRFVLPTPFRPTTSTIPGCECEVERRV